MYRVRAIKYGYQYYPGPAVFYFKYWGDWIYLDFYFWLLQSDEHTVLVDVGMDRAFADKANPYIIDRLKDDRGELVVNVDPPDALRQLGVAPEDVDYVVISHCHLDHIAAAPSFPNATFITSRYGLEWIMNPPYPGLADPIVMPREVVEFLYAESQKPAGRVILTDDVATPLPGIRTIRTGGHSMDSQIIFVETSKGTVGLGVDNVITFEHFETNTAPGSPVSLLDALRAMDLIRRESDIVIPGHDKTLYDRYPDGVIV